MSDRERHLSKDGYDAVVAAARKSTEEGLGQAREAKLGRRVQAALAKQPKPTTADRRLRWAGLAATVAAVLVLAVVLQERPSQPGPIVIEPWLVVYLGGPSHGETVDRLLDANDPVTLLKPGMRMALEPTNRLDVAIGEGSRMAVFGPAELRRTDAGDVVLEEGRASFSVAKRPKGNPFVVKAGRTDVVVLGTQFDLVVRQSQLQGARVSRGRISLRTVGSSQSSATLDAGQEFVTPGGQADAQRDDWPPDSFEAPWWSHESHNGMTQMVITSTPGRARVRIDDRDVGLTPLMVRWPSGHVQIEMTRAGYAPARTEIDLRAGQAMDVHEHLSPLMKSKRMEPKRWVSAEDHLAALRCGALERWSRSLASKRAAPQERARAKVLVAECLLRRGQKRRALKEFRDVRRAFFGTPYADAAAFEQAKLVDELQGSRAGLGAFDSYLRDYAKGRFVQEATMRRCEALLGSDKRAQALSCVNQFARRFPSGSGNLKAALLRGNIARLEGRWTDAARWYREYLDQAPRSPQADTAHYRLIECLRSGKLPGAEVQGRAYLERYPKGAHRKEVESWLEDDRK